MTNCFLAPWTLEVHGCSSALEKRGRDWWVGSSRACLEPLGSDMSSSSWFSRLAVTLQLFSTASRWKLPRMMTDAAHLVRHSAWLRIVQSRGCFANAVFLVSSLPSRSSLHFWVLSFSAWTLLYLSICWRLFDAPDIVNQSVIVTFCSARPHLLDAIISSSSTYECLAGLLQQPHPRQI